MDISKELPFLILKSNFDGGYACRRHSHREVSLGLIENGETEVTIYNRQFSLKTGDIILIPADTVHLCIPQNKYEFRFQMAYISTEWWNKNFQIKANSFIPFASPASKKLKTLFSKFKQGSSSLAEENIISIFREITRKLVQHDNSDSRQKDEIHSLHLLLRNVPEVRRNIDDYAKDLGISKFSLIRKYAKTYGLTPHADRINMRIQRAILLFEHDISLTNIATECGFSDQSHFIRCFKQYSGMQPREYRNAILSNSC